MNGIHDLGGGHGHGPVTQEVNEPIFHDDWERRTFSFFAGLAAAGCFNVDEFRHAIERMVPYEYFKGSYYEHWLHAFETLMVEKGYITEDELKAGKPASGTENQYKPALTKELVPVAVSTGISCRSAEPVKPKFKVGDKIRTNNMHPAHHTRLPRYARGKVGTVEMDHGVFVTPDDSAHGKENPQHVYSVSFDARELWGEQAAPNDTVRIDLWDNYMEAI